MFGFGKKKQAASENSESPKRAIEEGAIKEGAIDEAAIEVASIVDSPSEETPKGFFGRLRDGLSRTRSKLSDGIGAVVLGRKEVDAALLEDVETQLLSADVGLDATDAIIEGLRNKLGRKQLKDSGEFMRALGDELRAILAPCDVPLVIDTTSKPFVILMVGVNGVGKTTTIGKLAKRFQDSGKKVMLAAGDTFRAAAVEQLQTWGERNQVPVIAQATGADSASVIFDALQAAKARQFDVLIADTAGRLHTKDNLMDELSKIARVLKKIDPAAPHEVMLVVDAGTGQNALHQAVAFNAAIPLTGITLSKLDGTAKGGILFAIADKLDIPIRFIGIGEGIEDLRPFDAEDFVKALFSQETPT